MRPGHSALFVRTYILCACLAIGIGSVILLGGARRFNAPIFRTPRALVEWLPMDPHWSWGLLFLAHGVALALTYARATALHVLRFGIVVHLFMAIGVASSVALEARAPAVAVVGFLFFAGIHLFLSDYLAGRDWDGC